MLNTYGIKALAAAFLILMLTLPALAHPPSDLNLDYDMQNQTLNVTTTHAVSNPDGHFVRMVTIEKNGTEVLAREYRGQPAPTFSYEYHVNATTGDIIKATAYCSIAGSRSAEMIVEEEILMVQQAEEENAAPVNLSLPLDTISLPEGFTINIYAENLTYARSMDLSPNGTLFVGTRRPSESLDSPEGSDLYAIVDENENGHAEASEIFTIAEGLNNPNGVAFRDDSLYVAEIDRVIRFDDIETSLENPAEPVTIRELPQYIQHGWRYIGFGPDGRLYVAMGTSCNVCQKDDELNGTIIRMNADGSEMEVFARGIRNSVGFDWDPRTGEMWFTDNGRDVMGNDIPADELNHAPLPGLDFGFPTCHSGSIPDPDFGSDLNYSCDDMVPPAWTLGPHVAALGMKFYTGTEFPEEYQDQIFIAEHGSWNREAPIGYRVSVVRLQNNTAIDHEIFAEGWLQNDTAWGRPVDVQPLDDGSLLVSDDLNGVIYRISYG